MIPEESETDTLIERIEYLQSLLVARATGGVASNSDYTRIRSEFVSNPKYKSMLPRWLITSRSLDQFWHLIQPKFEHYSERRTFIFEQMSQIIDFIESGEKLPANDNISEALKKFDSEEIHHIWQKALERKNTDPEGAITISRTMLESTCKHILDKKEVEYNTKSIDLPELYRKTAHELNLAPDQHAEKIFKQILGGCSGIVNGLGTLRNQLGDAHGKGIVPVKPKSRHAELAVNLAGSMALFLISTYSDS